MPQLRTLNAASDIAIRTFAVNNDHDSLKSFFKNCRMGPSVAAAAIVVTSGLAVLKEVLGVRDRQ